MYVYASHRANQPANTPSEYYRRALVIPFLDTLISEMNMHFSNLTQVASKVVPSIIAEKPEPVENPLFVQPYIEDLPSPDLVLLELQCWRRKWCTSKTSQHIYSNCNVWWSTISKCVHSPEDSCNIARNQLWMWKEFLYNEASTQLVTSFNDNTKTVFLSPYEHTLYPNNWL